MVLIKFPWMHWKLCSETPDQLLFRRIFPKKCRGLKLIQVPWARVIDCFHLIPSASHVSHCFYAVWKASSDRKLFFRSYTRHFPTCDIANRLRFTCTPFSQVCDKSVTRSFPLMVPPTQKTYILFAKRKKYFVEKLSDHFESWIRKAYRNRTTCSYFLLVPYMPKNAGWRQFITEERLTVSNAIDPLV